MRCEVAWLSLAEGSKNLPSGWQRRELSADCFKGRNDNDYKLRWGEREGGARIQGCVDKFFSFSLVLEHYQPSQATGATKNRNAKSIGNQQSPSALTTKTCVSALGLGAERPETDMHGVCRFALMVYLCY